MAALRCDFTRLMARLLLAATIMLLGVLGAPVSTRAQAQTATQADYPVELVPQIEHLGGVRSVALSPDGRMALSGDNSGRLKLTDVASGKVIRFFNGHSDHVGSLKFSPDGRIALSGSADHTLRLWDLASGKEIRIFTGHSKEIHSVAFSPDGHAALSGSEDGTIKIWDLASGKEIRTFTVHSASIESISLSPDGRTVLSGGADLNKSRFHTGSRISDKTLKLWDVRSGKEIKTLGGHDGMVFSVAFSPDGRTALSGSDDNTLKLWDVASGKEIRTFAGHSNIVRSVAFSPDGRTALSGSEDNTLKLWDVASGKVIHTFTGHSEWVLSVVFSPDGRMALSGSLDTTLKLWDVVSVKEARTFAGQTNSFLSVAISPDGRTALAGCEDKTLMLFELASGRETRTFAGHSNIVRSVAFSPDGRTALSGSDDNTLKLWDVASGKTIRTFVGHSGIIRSVAFSPDGRTALSGGFDDSTKLWDVASGKNIRTFYWDLTYVDRVDFSPDGSAVLSGGDQWVQRKDRRGRLRLWDFRSGKIIRDFRGNSLGVSTVKFSPDGRAVLSGGEDGILELWDLASGKRIRTFTGHSDAILSISFSPDGRTALSGSRDHTLKLWDLASGNEIRTFNGNLNSAISNFISPDGRTALSVSWDRTIRLWDVGSGTFLATFYALGGDDHLTLTPEGFFDAPSREAPNRALAVVRGVEVYSLDQVYDQLYRPDLVREKLAGDPKGLVKAAAAKIDLDKAIGSGAPPAVKIVGAPASTASVSVRLEVEVTDRAGGIGRIEWRVNGVVTGLGNRGVTRTDPVPMASSGANTASGKARRFTQEVTLVPGENTIEVVAYNVIGLIASRPETVKITSTAATATDPGRLFVLAIGVNDYFDSRLALNYAVPDAKAIVDGFRAARGDVYAAVETRLLTDAEVTPEKFEAVLSEIGAKARPQDTFVMFVAGHGKTVDGRYYYLPHDFRYRDETSFAASGIGQSQFQDWLSRVKAQRSVLLFDTCESGSLTEDRLALRGVERAVAMEKMTAAMGRTTIAAASDDKPALEGYKGHGVFTYAILSGLSAADRNGDGKVDVLELIQYLDQEVPDLSNRAFKFRQIPQTKFSGNNFALAAKTAIVVDAPTSASPAAMPGKPTHVVIAPAEVLAAAGSGAAVGRLEAGTLVTIILTERGWALLGREGRQLGYVEETKISRVQ